MKFSVLNVLHPKTACTVMLLSALPLFAGAQESAVPEQPTQETREVVNDTVRVPYIPETLKDEIARQIKREVVAQARRERWGEPAAFPEWLKRFSFDGDFRMRAQFDSFAEDNADPQIFAAFGTTINNTTEDRDRLRLRARLGIQARVVEGVRAGFRLTTGSSTDPVSTNQTLGNSSNRYAVMFDRAYVFIDPSPWWNIIAGRMPNPWLSTDLVWDEDLNFDGIAVATTHNITEAIGGFATAGVFPLQEIEASNLTRAADKWLYGAQGGLAWLIQGKSKLTMGAALYDYQNITGRANTTLNSRAQDATAPQFRQKGNTVFNIDNDGNDNTALYALAAKFQEVNITLVGDIAHFDPVHVIVSADWVKNIGYNRQEIARKTGLSLPEKNEGYLLKVKVGHEKIKEIGDWDVAVAYKYLQRDAVLDAYTDSDFHLGGTDARGYILSANYGLKKNTSLRFNWIGADEIEGLPLAIDVVQVDLNVKF